MVVPLIYLLNFDVPPVCDVIVSSRLIVPVTFSNFKTCVFVSKLIILPEAEPEVVNVVPDINEPEICH